MSQRLENSHIRFLAEGSLMAALIFIMGLISTYVPGSSLILGFIWSIPLVLIIVRQGIKAGVLTLIVAYGLLLMFTGPIQSTFVLIQLSGVGIIYGYCFRKAIKPLTAILWGTIASALTMILVVILSALVAELPLMQWLTELRNGIDQIFDLYEQRGILENMVPEGMTLETYKANFVQTFEMVLPGILVAASMITAFINYFILRKFLMILRYQTVEMLPFREWRFSWKILWGLIIALMCYLLGKSQENALLLKIAVNVLYVYMPIFFLSGLALAAYFLYEFKFSRAVKLVLVFIIIIFFHVSFLSLLIFGLMDILFDYREIYRKMKLLKK